MKPLRSPLSAGWHLLLRETLRRLHRQFTSPWTKLIVLGALVLLFTRKELHFQLRIDGGSWITINEQSTISSLNGSDSATPVLQEAHARLADYTPPQRDWTARQLQQLAYVDKYRLIALAEMGKHGIPASITLAQGLLESGTGRSTLARKNNNHFGIKCFSKKCRKGHCSNHSDDHHKDFFRIFSSPEESFQEHSKILLKNRYRKLFSLATTDYQGWAHGLRQAGYATDPRYGDKLIRMIEELELWRYDQLTA